MFIAAQAGMGLVDFGKRENPLMEAVRAISITGEGRELTPEERELEAMRGPRVADSWEKDPRNPANRRDMTELVETGDGERMPRWLVEGDDVASQNREGSYEELMRGWGNGGRQAFGTELLK